MKRKNISRKKEIKHPLSGKGNCTERDINPEARLERLDLVETIEAV